MSYKRGESEIVFYFANFNAYDFSIEEIPRILINTMCLVYTLFHQE